MTAPATSFAQLDDATAVRRAAAELARGLGDGPGRLELHGLDAARTQAAVEGGLLGAYRFSRATTRPGIPALEFVGGDPDAVEAGRRAAGAAGWARELANERSNVKTPAWLGAQAQAVLEPLGVQVAVRDDAWLGEQGFGGVLAVGAGSAAPPRLIEARWRPRGAAADPHVVLVGKGITFDTGGINRKTGHGMDLMYTDMAGGAAVLGAVHAVASARLPLRVTVLVPSAQNSLSGSAYRPGDVIRHVGGRTSEVTNTDAEGRLVLADALAYAVRRLRPSTMVDVATLTGAARTALGTRTGALFATSDQLARQLTAAGDATDEPLWRLPLSPDYESLLGSSVADAVNAPGAPGAITAALFLKHFAGSVPWAHLDIAGPARSEKDDGVLARGATGFGARLLAAWLGQQAAQRSRDS